MSNIFSLFELLIEICFWYEQIFGQFGFPWLEQIIVVDYPRSVTTGRWRCNKTYLMFLTSNFFAHGFKSIWCNTQIRISLIYPAIKKDSRRVQILIQYCVQNMCKSVLCWSEDYSSKVCFKNMTLRPSNQFLRVRQWGSGSVQVGKYWPSRAQALAQWQTRIQGRESVWSFDAGRKAETVT